MEALLTQWQRQKLPLLFYASEDVVQVAQSLLGKILVTHFADGLTAGRIVETEAYAGVTDKASHAYKGRTRRTAVMFDTTGTAYIYLCYGLHQMFNVVTGPPGVAHAVLVRATAPLAGAELMALRTGKKLGDSSVARGPGNVGKAFGFHISQSGTSLLGNEIFIADDVFVPDSLLIRSSPRIGVAYAAEHADWPYRFFISGDVHVSGIRRNK